jgi:hypothetical protein
MSNPPTKIFLDANVLAKPLTRTVILLAAEASNYTVTWSRHVEVEANRHLRSKQTSVTHVRQQANLELSPTGKQLARFPNTSPTDQQVLADADAAQAMFLITENVTDFAENDLTTAGITACNPDLFLAKRATTSGYLEALSFISKISTHPPFSTTQIHIRLGRIHPLTTAAHGTGLPKPNNPTHNPPTVLYRGNHCLTCLQTRQTNHYGTCINCTP